jgi:hypothetical protein
VYSYSVSDISDGVLGAFSWQAHLPLTVVSPERTSSGYKTVLRDAALSPLATECSADADSADYSCAERRGRGLQPWLMQLSGLKKGPTLKG